MKRITLLLLIWIPLRLFAHVEGMVVDDSGVAMPFANIYWMGTTLGAVSDTAGLFEIEPVHQTRMLVASFTGYRSDTIKVDKAGAFITFVLVSDLSLDEIEVRERKVSVLKSRVSPLNTETLTGQELCKAACCNLSESFETNASVDVHYADAATGAKQIKLLGLSGTYVQMLTENTPNVRGLAQTFGMEYIPGSWMDAIQVSKGTSSVLNGYEAVTGQINVEYLKPQTSDPVDVNAILMSDLHKEVDVTGGWNINEKVSTGLLFHVQGAALPEDNNKDGMLDAPISHAVNLMNRWYIKDGDYTGQVLIRGLYDNRVGGQTDGAKATLAHPYEIRLNTWRVDGFMKNGYVLDDDLGTSIGVIAAASYHSQTNSYGTKHWNANQANAYVNAIFQTHFEDMRLDPQDNHEHALSAGLSFNYDQYDEQLKAPVYWSEKGDIETDNDLSRREITPGVFAEYTYSYKDLVTLLLGVREDYSTRYGFFFTPRMNIRYAPFAWWTLRASAGLGYRSPNAIADNTAYLPSNRTYTFLTKDLSQEQALNTGFTTTFYVPIGNRELSICGEYYYTRFMKGVIVDVDANRYGVTYYNLSDIAGAQSFAHSAQIELNMEVLRGWTWMVAFRYSDAQQTSFSPSAGTYVLRSRALQNSYKAVVSTSYQTPQRGWQFDVTAQFNGPGRMPEGFEIPNGSNQYEYKNGQIYHTWFPQLMAQVTKNFKSCSIYLGSNNMTNFTQHSPIAGSRVGTTSFVNPYSKDFDAGMVWGPIQGWDIYLGFRWSMEKK